MEGTERVRSRRRRRRRRRGRRRKRCDDNRMQQGVTQNVNEDAKSRE